MGTPYRKIHVLLIGINEYRSSGIGKLRYAEADLKAMHDVLVESYGLTESDIVQLVGPQATAVAIRQELSNLSDSERVGESDAVLVYFSGHGQSLATGDGNVGYLIPYDAQLSLKDRNPGPYNAYALSMRSLWDTLDTSPARHVLVIADACFSGLLVTPRGEAGEKSARPTGNFAAVNFGHRGREVMAACDSTQVSKEDSGLGHGRFTWALIQEMKNRARVGEPFFSDDLFGVVRKTATFTAAGQEQTPTYGTRDRAIGLFTFTPSRAVAESVKAAPGAAAASKSLRMPSSDAIAYLRTLASKGTHGR